MKHNRTLQKSVLIVKRRFFALAVVILLLLGPTVYLTLIHPKSTEAAPWAQTAGSWTKRKNVILTNNSGQTFEANTTYAVNINTQELVAAGDLNADCSDLRVYYQPTDTTSTKLAYYFDVAAGATNCSDSLATKVYFPLQANLSNGTNATEYYIYYDNASAVTEASVDAFNVGSKQALMVCPFNGDTECINGDGAESPTTATGAIRYSGGKSALSFDGKSDFINLGNPTSLNNIALNSQLTLETWLNLDSVGGPSAGHHYLFQTNNNDDPNRGGWSSYWGWGSPSTGAFSLNCVTTDASSTPTTTLPANEWFHYAITYSDTGDRKIHIFVNGTEVSYSSQVACDGNLVDDSMTNKYIWTSQYGAASELPTQIDEVRFSDIVRYTSNFTPQTSPFVRDEHTRLLLHFDENGDDPRNTGKAIDDSGNGNHGTITGAKYIAGLIGTDASTTDTGNNPSSAYASHDGIFIEEGTTNKITNPSFEHTTFDTNWTSAVTGTLTLQPDGTAGTDTRIYEADPTTNNGTSNYLHVNGSSSGYKQFSLLKFDLSSLSGMTITDATLSFYQHINNYGVDNSTNTIHRVLSGNSGWTETGATWNTTNGTNSWAGSAGASTADTDYSSTSMGSFIWDREGAVGTEYAVSLSTTELSTLVSNNYGIILRTTVDGDASRLASSDHTTSSYRPKLVVNYTYPLTLVENTTAPYYKFGSKSAKITAPADGNFTTSVNVGNTNTHTLSAYIYDGTSGNVGGTVSSSVAVLVFNGATQTTTYTDMGGGWWRLTYSGTGIASAQNFGVQVKSGKTVYVDGVQLEEKAYSTTYTDGTLGTGYAWSGTAHASTSSRTVGVDRYATTNNIDRSQGAISIWYRIDRPLIDGNTAFGLISFKDDTSQILGLEVTNCQWQSRFRDGSEAAQSFNGDCNGHNGSTGKWHHVVLNWQNGTQTLYRNTSLKMTTAFSTGSSLGSNPYISIGEGYSAWDISYPTNGVISEVRIYSTPLTATEVADLYYTGLGSHQIQSDYTERFSGTEGPVLNWHMDEGYGTTAHDSTLKANHGTISGATWTSDTFSSPPQGKSLQFDGSNDYVYKTYASDAELNPGSQPFSVSVWFKHASAQSDTDTLLARYSGSGYKLYMNSSGYLCFGVDDDSTWGPDDSACSTTSYADSVWHLATAVRDSTSIALYIDGIKAASDDSLAITGHLSGTNPTIYAGIDSDGSSSPWTGFLDEVRIYAHALTTTEILAELSARGSVKGVSAAYATNGISSSLNQGLVGYWKMDESSGDRSDSSGNGNTLTDYNTVTTGTGKYGNAGLFNSTNSEYLRISDNSSLSSENSDFFISAWIYLNSTGGMDVVAKRGPSGYEWQLVLNADTKLALYINGVGTTTDDENILSSGNWYFIVGWYNNTSKEIGVRVFGKNPSITYGSGSLAASAAEFQIGRASGFYFNGLIDEVRFYKRILAPNEISALYDYAPGPIAHLALDEGGGQSGYDKSGNDNTGTLGASSSPGSDDPIWTNGKYDKALSFDGSDDYVGLANSSALNFSANQGFTINGWLKTTESYGSVVSFRNSSSSYPVLDINVGYNGDARNAGYLSIYVREDGHSGGGISYTSSKTVNNGQWQYFTLIRNPNSGTINVYLNGIYDGTASSAYADGGITTNLRGLGAELRWIQDAYGNADDCYFVGQIDDVLVYNYARTPQQIVEDMNAGHPAPGSPVGSPIGYWKFDEGYGDTANDSSPQNIDGDLSGTTTCPSATICPTWTNSGKIGKALYFGDLGTADGDSHVRLTNDAYDTQTQGAISIWFKPDDTGDNAQNIFAVGGSTTDFLSIQLNNTDNTLVYGVKDENTVVVAAASPAIQNYTNWHHLVWNMSASGNELFIDGVKQSLTYAVGTASTDAWFDNLSDNATSIYSIGCIVEDTDTNDCLSTELFKGYLDEIKIYSFPLTADQVKVEYNQGKSQVLGALSSASDGVTADNSASRAYCPPGNTEGNCAAGQNPAPSAHFTFDEGSGAVANDISGNSLTGTISGSATYISGKYGHGLELGSGKYVTLTGEGSTLSTNNKTISAWIYRTSDSGFDEYIIDNQDANGDGWFMFISSLDKLECYYNGAQSLSSDSLSVGRWYHIACTTDGSTQKLYLDGVQVDNDAITGSISESNDARIGARSYTSPSGALNAIVDDFRIYPYARTHTQLTWDYNRGAPAAWYKFDECDGGTLHSSNATYNTGLNATWYGSSSGSQTSVGNCETVGSAWYNGSSGKFNASLNFDGTDDYVSPGDLSILDNSTQTSISMWFKTSSNPSDQRILFDKGNSLRIEFNSSNLQILTGNGSSWVLSNGEVNYANSQLSTSTWHHVVLKFDGQVSSLYVDGNLVDYISDSSFNLGNNSNIYSIGDYGAVHGTYNFSGQIDDVRIYNYALSQPQITTIYNNGAVYYAK